MKIERKESFEPVTITLETQEEVDMFYALFNYVPISIKVDKLKEGLSQFIRDELKSYMKNYQRYHSMLQK